MTRAGMRRASNDPLAKTSRLHRRFQTTCLIAALLKSRLTISRPEPPEPVSRPCNDFRDRAQSVGRAERREAQRFPACVTLGFLRQPNQPRVVADDLFADDPRAR